MNDGMTTFNTSREIPATVEEVWAAFTDSARLARWWGPAGFTNTFHTCEFETGGRWVYTDKLHAPTRKSTFYQVKDGKIVKISDPIDPPAR